MSLNNSIEPGLVNVMLKIVGQITTATRLYADDDLYQLNVCDYTGKVDGYIDSKLLPNDCVTFLSKNGTTKQQNAYYTFYAKCIAPPNDKIHLEFYSIKKMNNMNELTYHLVETMMYLIKYT